jgi:crotonobetainyl-CoA:carnitine CoA-transferase CaiB-like acyl-CoA transferase
VTKDPQVLENGFVQKVAFENGTEAYIPTIPIQFSDYGILPVKPAARLGKDTEEVLKELGYTKEQISALTAEGSVR